MPEAASRVAAVPYDVVSTAEARALAAGDPLSFLHVTRPEIDLPADLNPYDEAVYAQASLNFEALKREAPLVIDEEPRLYLYRLRMGAHEQTGVAGCFSLEEYASGGIRKHELTRRDKEDDRTRHMLELRAQTGLVFLTYRASAVVDRLVAAAAAAPPLYDFVAPDEVSHTVWSIGGALARDMIDAFARLDALYIADGHHRAASADRACRALRQHGARAEEAGRFVAVAFPDAQVQILPYNRVVRDLQGHAPEEVLARVRAKMRVDEAPPQPRAGEASMFLAGRWYRLALPKPPQGAARAEALDVSVLEREVLGPILGIGDVRADKRIDFVGGARGVDELERRVRSGDSAVAFALHPVAIDDLMAIADSGGLMPPKSTWFEPKLRDGLLVHLI